MAHRSPPSASIPARFARSVRIAALLAALAAPAMIGGPAQAADAPRVFGESANLAGKVDGQGQPQAAPSHKPAYLQEDQPLQLKDYEEPKPAAPEPWYQQLFSFVFKLVMVIGLIILSLNLLKKINTGRFALPTSKGRNVVVLESTSLTQQQAVHLVSLGGERLLVIGSSPQGLTTLSEITDPHAVRALSQAHKPNATGFNQVFDLEAVVQESGSDLFDETVREVRNVDGRPRRDWPRS